MTKELLKRFSGGLRRKTGNQQFAKIAIDDVAAIIDLIGTMAREIGDQRFEVTKLKRGNFALIEALMAMDPGLDWAMAVRSSISSSSIQCSSFTKRSRIKGIMTNPPPKVQALNLKVDRNNCQYLFFLCNRIGLLFQRYICTARAISHRRSSA